MRRLWLALAVSCLTHAAFAAIPASERFALDRIYVSLGGPDWKDDTGWGGAAGTECHWEHVVCNSAGDHVIKIDLAWSEAKGTIPIEISALTKLEYLDLQNNAIVGTLPA
jgi:hypothetical protein